MCTRQSLVIYVTYKVITLCILVLYFFKKYFINFRERGKEGERGGENHQYVVASRAPPTGDLAHNPGVCPDW